MRGHAQNTVALPYWVQHARSDDCVQYSMRLRLSSMVVTKYVHVQAIGGGAGLIIRIQLKP